jgi:hypothetical protein
VRIARLNEAHTRGAATALPEGAVETVAGIVSLIACPRLFVRRANKLHRAIAFVAFRLSHAAGNGSTALSFEPMREFALPDQERM